MIYEMQGLNDTKKFANRMARTLKGDEIVLLHGDLGAGKTAFTQFLAAELGVKESVTSPTFAFMRSYQGNFPFYHYDMYRAESEDDVWELGIGDPLEEFGICVIEWNKFREFPEDKKIITITIEKGSDDKRIFHVEGWKE